jgi:hypothetical protein
MEQLSTLIQTHMGLSKKDQLIFRAQFALLKCKPDKSESTGNIN